MLTADDPFGIGDQLTDVTIETFAQFPFLPPIETGHFGGIYEFRTDHLQIGGLAQVLADWQDALPKRTRLYPMTTAMFGLDGSPRITHIWPYPDLNARLEIRRDAADRGIWPPDGESAHAVRMTSTIAFPTSISPLR